MTQNNGDNGHGNERRNMDRQMGALIEQGKNTKEAVSQLAEKLDRWIEKNEKHCEHRHDILSGRHDTLIKVVAEKADKVRVDNIDRTTFRHTIYWGLLLFVGGTIVTLGSMILTKLVMAAGLGNG